MKSNTIVITPAIANGRKCKVLTICPLKVYLKFTNALKPGDYVEV